MKIKDCMCNSICYCRPYTTIGEVAKTMSKNHVGCIPVCDDTNNLVGIVTDRDIVLRAVANNKDNTTKVSEIMSTDTISCEANSELVDVSKTMRKEQIRRIPVTEKGVLVGMLTLGDLAKNAQVNNEFVGFTAECICANNDKNAE